MFATLALFDHVVLAVVQLGVYLRRYDVSNGVSGHREVRRSFTIVRDEDINWPGGVCKTG